MANGQSYTKGKHAGLPQYSKTSDLYFKGTKMGEALQALIFDEKGLGNGNNSLILR